MERILEILVNSLVSVIAIGIPIALAVIAWIRRNFLNWVHVSFNWVETRPDGRKTIKIRTIANVVVRQLLLNNFFATFLTYRAARRATTENPVLEFSEETAWRIKNLCRGYVSSLFPDGVLARLLGQPVKQEWFVVTLILDETQKGDRRIGLAIIKREHLLDPNQFAGADAEWELEAPKHHHKLCLLRAVQQAYLREQNSPGEHFKFLDVELSLPVKS